MSLPISTVFPSYNNTTNYSGVNAVIRSAGPVSNIEQAEAVNTAQREGRLGLSQFEFIKLPRDVLFLQDERGAKIKSGNISSATKSDLDDERLLQKIDDPKKSVSGLDAKSDATEKDVTEDDAKKDDPPAPQNPASQASLLGSGSDFYQGVIGATHAGLAGRNLSVLA